MHSSHDLLYAAKIGNLAGVVGTGSVTEFLGKQWVAEHPRIWPDIQTLEALALFCTQQASVNELDTLLQRSDSDSMRWADGGDAEIAEEMLASLPKEDWLRVKDLCSSRDSQWRACLASILRPQQGEFAQRLLLDLAWDQELEVAFLAVSGIAFYCGVNDGRQGPFIDLKTRNPTFLSRAKSAADLVVQVRKVSALCYPTIQARFELLAQTLEKQS
ncbi:hypothetical protein [Piscinibacter terrae]|uniref:hypothetical protein n=1 Tax=Piscinibacter terrae TaxID=2496871 RepID=UPI0018E0B577|nr:hypothetical protein [Albitalea terrae]